MLPRLRKSQREIQTLFALLVLKCKRFLHVLLLVAARRGRSCHFAQLGGTVCVEKVQGYITSTTCDRGFINSCSITDN